MARSTLLAQFFVLRKLRTGLRDASVDDQRTRSTWRRSRSNLARPRIWRLCIFDAAAPEFPGGGDGVLVDGGRPSGRATGTPLAGCRRTLQA
jgi:hypothetical protein